MITKELLNTNNLMKLGTKVKFKYGNSIVVGTLISKKDNTYLVDIDTINNTKQEHKTVITVTTTTVLNYLFDKESV